MEYVVEMHPSWKVELAYVSGEVIKWILKNFPEEQKKHERREANNKREIDDDIGSSMNHFSFVQG